MVANTRTRSQAARTHPSSTHPPVQHVGPVLAAASAGDADAWEVLVRHFAGLIASVTWSYRLGPADQSDVAQHVWLRLVENVDRVREPEALPGWIRTVAHRECLKLVNRGRREFPSTAVEDDQTAGTESVDTALLDQERRATLHRALGSLPAKQETMMRYLLSDPAPSYEDVSVKLNMAVGSIGPTRQRVVERLRSDEALSLIR